MATLTLTLAGSSVINGSKVYTISDADVQTWINMMILKYSSPPPAPPLTAQQALLAWAQNTVINVTTAEVFNLQTNDAINKLPVIPPIVFT